MDQAHGGLSVVLDLREGGGRREATGESCVCMYMYMYVCMCNTIMSELL